MKELRRLKVAVAGMMFGIHHYSEIKVWALCLIRLLPLLGRMLGGYQFSESDSSAADCTAWT